MKYLFIHQNFPAQFLHAAAHLAATGHQVLALTQRRRPVPSGVQIVGYAPTRRPGPGVHRFASSFDAAMRNAQGAGEACQRLADQGFRPDLVVGHTGWGETLFLKDVWPSVPVLGYFEFFYRFDSSDITFDPEFPPEPQDAWRARALNATVLLALEAVDGGQTPTRWQQSTFPSKHHPQLSVLHDGINTDAARPSRTARMMLDRRIVLTGEDQVITYSARNLEPYRGFHIFMRALARLQRRNPKVQAVIVGGDGVSYGRSPTRHRTYRDQMLDEMRGELDLSRVHFTGPLPYQQYVAMLQISRVHVYLTYPFVLSWSLLEAMAAGCAVVGSRTAPVQEVIEDGHNGFLVDFFDADALAYRINDLLVSPDVGEIRAQARKTVLERFDLRTICLPRQLALFDALAPR